MKNRARIIGRSSSGGWWDTLTASGRVTGQAQRWGWWLLALMLLALAACSSTTPTPAEVPAPTETPTATPDVAGVPVESTQLPRVTLIPQTTPPPSTLVSPAPTPAPGFSLQLPNVPNTVERVRPAVVALVSEVVTQDFFGGSRSGFSSGTGVIIDPEGLVLTNNHVIQGAERITATLDDGSQVEAELVGADSLSDLAVLRIPGSGHPFLPVNRDVQLRVGESVIAIGNALALPGGPTVTVGVVSALGRSIDVQPGMSLYDLVQTDTVINPGNSGGPLTNLRGELIGINTAVLRGDGGGGPPVEGIGFAINMETAALVSEQLIELGRVRWPHLGVLLTDLTPELAAATGLLIQEGVMVRDVVGGGPADAAGVLAGDVILSLGGQNVATVRELSRQLRQEFQVGQEIEVEVFRDGVRETLLVVLGERPP